jgi:PHP family Zn ribbon phosphoesterase
LEELKNKNPQLSTVIEAFRNKTLQIQPGGGGKYGKILIGHDNEFRNTAPDNTLDIYF